MTRRLRLVAMLASGLIASSLATGTAFAQEPNQVTGVGVEQADGFATLSWDPVAGATDYQIVRTPVDAANAPTGPAAIVGLWRPNRTVTPGSPTFAEAGFNPGDRFQWRVRARTGTTAHPFSAPVFDTTLPQWGNLFVPGENLRTQWESTQAAQFTSDVEEYAYTAALVNCNVHGNEPSSREACLILARELAFADDPRTLDILSNLIVLIVPAINGDGGAADTRTNAAVRGGC